MPPDLADDRRHGVRRKLDTLLELEAVDRLDEADRADLDEVLRRLSTSRVAVCQRADERHQLLHEPVARLYVAVLEVRDEERALITGGHVSAPRRARR